MSLLGGYALGGLSGSGPSTMYDSLPYEGYKNVRGSLALDGWIIEFIDSMGLQWDVLNALFLTADARANFLDPTYTPGVAAGDVFATATACPSAVTANTDTMLDVLCYIACGIYPMDTNLSVAQKQLLVQAGFSALRRKATRRQLFNVASRITGRVVDGWIAQANELSLIIPDGAPSPGHGSWVPSSTDPASIRPWVMQGERNVLANIFPAWASLGVGYSQFRAGYSAAGEPVFSTGCRINRLANEHFSAWTAGVPDSWTQGGTAGLTQYASGSINWEFSGYCAQFDLTTSGSGTSGTLSQTTSINNQLDHLIEIDYDYFNSNNIRVLGVQIIDSNYNVTTATDYYWDDDNEVWTTTATTNYLDVSSSSGVRTRASFNITPQSPTSATNYRGTSSLQVRLTVTCDGTATSQLLYNIYRVGVYEKFSTTIDAEATGERSMWLPLVDALGYTTWSGSLTASSYQVQDENGDKSIVRQLGSVAAFDYHPAIAGRGYRSNRSWQNLVLGSNTFDTGSDFTLTSASAGATISGHIIGANASSFTSSAANARVQTTASLGNPSSKSYIAGCWVKKVAVGNDSTSYPVTLALRSNVTVVTQTYRTSPDATSGDGSLAVGDGWELLIVGPYTFGGGLATLRFDVTWGDATNQNIGIASMFVYDVTGATDLKYPPVIQTPIHATATLGASTLKATTNTTDTDTLDKFTRRNLIKISSGFLSLVVVPVYGQSSMPNNMTIFDFGQDATHNRLQIYLNNTAGSGGGPGLVCKMWDTNTLTTTATIDLSSGSSPATANTATWLRDTSIPILVRWDSAGNIAMSAGNGNSPANSPSGSWSASDSALAKIRIGCDIAGANQFDGIITQVESLQIGLAS